MRTVNFIGVAFASSIALAASGLSQTATEQNGLNKQELLAKCDRTSAQIFNPAAGLHAKFRVEVALGPSTIKDDERQFEGSYELIQVGEYETLTAEFEKAPSRARERGFLSKQVIYRDSNQLVRAFPNSKQAVVLDPGPIPVLFHPLDLLSPFERSSLSQLVARSTSMSANVRDGGDVHFSISLPGEGQGVPTTISGVLSAAANFALSEWKCDAMGRSCHLEYAQGDNGPFPIRAVMTFDKGSCGSGLFETVTIETIEFGAVSDQPQSPISPGFVVHDVREARPVTCLEYYAVGPRGEQQNISVVETEPVATTSTKLTSGALVALFVCGIAGLRLLLPGKKPSRLGADGLVRE